MKNPNYILLAVLVILSAAVSCKKDNPKGKYGVDGVTPLPEAVDLGTVVNGKYQVGIVQPRGLQGI